MKRRHAYYRKHRKEIIARQVVYNRLRREQKQAEGVETLSESVSVVSPENGRGDSSSNDPILAWSERRDDDEL